MRFFTVVIAPAIRRCWAGGAKKVSKEAELQGITKQQSDDAKKRQGAIEARGLKWIVAHLKANPREILSTKAELEAGLGKAMTEIHEDNKEKESSHGTHMAFKSLPRWWIADWMVSKCKFAPKFVDLIDSMSGQLKHVFAFLTGLSEFTCWPRPALKIAVLGEFVSFMAEQLGSRWVDFDKMVDVDGRVKWLEVCPFMFERGGARPQTATSSRFSTAMRVRRPSWISSSSPRPSSSSSLGMIFVLSSSVTRRSSPCASTSAARRA